MVSNADLFAACPVCVSFGADFEQLHALSHGFVRIDVEEGAQSPDGLAVALEHCGGLRDRDPPICQIVHDASAFVA